MKVSRAVLASALAALVCACVRAPVVERAYGGRVVVGAFIEPEAYAAFLRGSIAEAEGNATGAIAAYGQAQRIDSTAADIWTHIGDVRCRANPRDAEADMSFARALQIDPTDTRAWTAKATCALARGDVSVARAAAQRAVERDPNADRANVIVARTAPPQRDATTRAALVSLTLTSRDPVAAWDALATWAKAKGDVSLWSRSLRELVRIAPTRREAVAFAAEALAGAGQIGEARRVAAAVVNADERPLGGDHALVARLALDEAIARADPGAARRRATRVRLPMDEAAGRAFLAGERPLARALASAMAEADPTAISAQLILSACDAGQVADTLGEGNDTRTRVPPAPAAAFIAFGIALLRTASPDHVRDALARVPHEPIVAGDDRVVRPAVELASRGALSAEALPPDGVVELAALQGQVPSEALTASGEALLDARHEYLALALLHPQAARTKELAARLRKDVADPVVGAASALIQLASGAPIAAGVPQALLSRNSADPLLANVALRLAEKVGDEEVAQRARRALTALGTGRRAVE